MVKSKASPFRLDVAGRKKLLEFFQDFDMDGYISDIKVRRMIQEPDSKKGTVTYGVTIRGYTSGNIDLEIPLTFDADLKELSIPVIAFINGRATLINQGLMDSLLSSYNFEKKFYPGWMDVYNLTSPASYFIYNRFNERYSNKIGKKITRKKEWEDCVNDFLINMLSGNKSVGRVFKKKIKNIRGSNEDELTSLILSFGSRIRLSSIINIYEYTLSKKSNINKIYNENRVVKAEDLPEFPEYNPLDFIEDEEEKDEDLPEFPDYSPLDFIEEEPEELEVIPVPSEYEEQEFKDVDIVIPETYTKIVYPEPRELIELIRLYRIIRFTYKKLNDEWVMRTGEPHYLWLTKKGNIICILWDYYRGNWRAFDISRMKDVEVYYSDRWLQLGQFLEVLENFRQEGAEIGYDYTEIFSPRGPYHDSLVYVRGNLKKMNSKFGEPLRGLVDNMIEKIELCLGG